ncbi:MAG: hypothetical protein AAFV51_01400 [Pseudomonadota bacterium]
MFDEHTEALIEKLFDDDLTADERRELEALAASNSAVRRRLEDDAMVRSFLQSATGRWRRSAFTDRVMAEIAEEAALQDLLSAHKPLAFRPPFVQRVMNTIQSSAFSAKTSLNGALSEALVRLFPRVAAPVIAVIGVVMISNIHAATAGTPLIDALFGLPSEGELGADLVIYSGDRPK